MPRHDAASGSRIEPVEPVGHPARRPSRCSCCFRFSSVWTGICLGLLTRDEEAAGWRGPDGGRAGGAPSRFVRGLTVQVAEWNPVSAVATALRDLFGNAPVPADAAWPVAHPVAGSLLWCAVLLAVFVPLAVRQYGHGER